MVGTWFSCRCARLVQDPVRYGKILRSLWFQEHQDGSSHRCGYCSRLVSHIHSILLQELILSVHVALTCAQVSLTDMILVMVLTCRHFNSADMLIQTTPLSLLSIITLLRPPTCWEGSLISRLLCTTPTKSYE
jgi:hypothetical protein